MLLALDLAQRYNHFMNERQRKELLRTLSTEIAVIFGENLFQVLLYGSYARGEARPDSDLDILIVMKDKFDHGTLIHQTSELIARLSLENDVVISCIFMEEQWYLHRNGPLLRNIRREGIAA